MRNFHVRNGVGIMFFMMKYDTSEIINDLLSDDGQSNVVNYLMPIVDSSSIPARPLDDMMPNIKASIIRINRSLSIMNRHRSVIVTGESGSGKTYAIKQLVAHNNDLYHPHDHKIYYRRYDSVLFSNLMNSPEMSMVDTKPALVLSDVIQRMAALDAMNDDKLVLIVNQANIASAVHRIAPHITILLELSSSDADLFTKDEHDIVDKFEFIDINQDPPTFRDMLIELVKRDRDLSQRYASSLTEDQLCYAMRTLTNVALKDSISGFKLTYKTTILLSIDFYMTAIEHLHVWLDQHGLITVDHLSTSAYRKNIIELFKDLPNHIDHDSSNYMIADNDLDMDDNTRRMIMDDDRDDEEDRPKPKPVAYSDISTLAERLKSKVINQDKAIDQLVDCIKIDASGLRRKDSPIATVLFDGPSGVGKTELAKQLALELFNDPVQLIRLDMSEYSSKEDVTKLFGSAPGYQDSELGGQLTNKVMNNPQSVILLDEAEKANPKVWNSFLQVFDDGRMTDSRGKTADFTNTIIILTSNLGNKESITSKAGFGFGDAALIRSHQEVDGIMRKSLDKYFAPELLARLDVIVTFNSLRKEDLEKIVMMQLSDLADILCANHKHLTMDMNIDRSIIDLILSEADTSKFGAREVQRVIRRIVTLPLSDWVISYHEHNHEDDILMMKRKNDMIIFQVIMKEQSNAK
jgi:Ni2+-binding GTPase involved in maturation of urease and hydrogenase